MPLTIVGLGGAILLQDDRGPAVPGSGPLTAAMLACPDLAVTPPGAHVPLLPGPAGLDVRTGTTAGRVQVSSRDAELRTTLGSGRLALGSSAGGAGAVLLTGRDDAAAGLSAVVTAAGDGAGPARARCVPPVSRSWFAGPSTAAGRDPVLVLANMADQPARASVRTLADGPAGPPVDITVPPGRTVTRRLAALAPEAATTALDVQVRAGRIVAWMTDRSSSGGPFTAPRLVPATAPPGRRLLLGGVIVPSGPPAPAATLVLAAPGTATTVRVSILTASGRRTPIDLADVPVPAGGALAVPVPLPAGAASAVLVESTGAAAPVFAELGVASGWPGVWTWAPASRVEAPSGGQALDAYGRGVGRLATAGPTTGPGTASDAVVAVPPTPAGAVGAVVLTAPLGPVTARLDGVPVRVDAGSVRVMAAPVAGRGGRLVAEGGPLVATSILGAGPAGAGASSGALRVVPRVLSAAVPLTGAPSLAELPAGVADPALAYR
ncbi:conserved hypothetical protein [Frankia canadensis]|uniref:Secreted protein n=1 Tax=Frankia canadensis TaxID=1836972 RepID=A0A2I2KSS7_9ACTN|nr:conserved hypothetical protein [Frankia canadensis]SOU56018.1 conserved hypothetical protein [Frankia canadensis]